MKPDLFLHIGMKKTGTSSIQATFFKNRQRLLKHDINYLSINQNHSETIYPLFCEKPHLYHMNKRAGIDTVRKAQRRNATIERTLTRELQSNRSSRFVISGEDLLLLRAAGVESLRTKLEPFVREFRVIVYVREPYSFINSAFQQRLRAGATYERLLRRPPLPRYYRIGNFIDAFGRERIDIRVFDVEKFPEGSLIADFLDALGADPTVARELEVARKNEALSHEAALILKGVNAAYPIGAAGAQHPNRAPHLPLVLRAIVGQPFHCPNEVFASVRPKVVKDLEWLHATVGKRLFSDSYPQLPDVSSANWSDETLRSIGILINDLVLANAKHGTTGLQELHQGLRARLGSLLQWRMKDA